MKVIVIVAIFIAANIAVFLGALAVMKRKPPLCDSCKKLVVKNGGTCSFCSRYRCSSRSNGFDRAPEYCVNYERRDNA